MSTDNSTIVEVKGLYKKFSRNLRNSITYGTLDMMRNFLGVSLNRMKLRKSEFWALEDVNFELKRGESLGLIGMNGSGKSTLLRLLTGIYPPDHGVIRMKGNIGALISVGAGFHPHMTGRENIHLNGTILGMSNKEIKAKFQDIVDFAEIGEFIDAPVSTYSSGMVVRLGFAISIHSDPDLLLIDEILAVGDMKFQQKCMAKIGELVENGVSIILVSHQMQNIQKICDKALLLDKGKVVAYGDTVKVIGEYYKLNSDYSHLSKEEKKDDLNHAGIKYEYLKYFNEKGEETRTFVDGEDITIECKFHIPGELNNVNFHFSFSDSIYTYNGYVTLYDQFVIKRMTSATIIRLKIKNPALTSGRYIVSIGLWDKNFVGSYFWDYDTPGHIIIESGKKLQGRFEFQHEWDIQNAEIEKLN